MAECDPAGGSGELAGLIDEAGEFIVSDLSFHHGIKPWEIIDGTYSPRVILAYIRNLPMDSATAAHLRGGQQFRGWGLDQYLYANLIDAVQFQTYAFVKANSKRSPEKPKPVERPTVKNRSGKDPSKNMFMARARSVYNKSKKGRA